jgi:hypothetical protein
MKRNLKLEVKGMQIKTILIVAMLCLAMVGIAVAPGTPVPEPEEDCCWAKPCGTPVEQCDKETTFALYGSNATIVKTIHGYIYVDMEPDKNGAGQDIITAGDIRLSNWHTNYDPNTKVVPSDQDNLDVINNSYTAPIHYVDVNDNGMYDLYDGVVYDLDGDNRFSNGDILQTAIPAVDQYSLEEDNAGDFVRAQGVYGDAWDRVSPGHPGYDMIADGISLHLKTIGSGVASDLIKWVDADDSNDWSCEDKLYLIQPHDEDVDKFDDFVTIGDTRVYIPEGDECIPECGTKVVQGDQDATYILMKTVNAKLAYYSFGAETEWYVDMDANHFVSFGDIRLTEVSEHYGPNTKVKICDEFDLGHDLTWAGENAGALSDQTAVRYAETDGLLGYTLGDRVYVDINDYSPDGIGNYVEAGDIRLVEAEVYLPGFVNPFVYDAWSVVESNDADVGDRLFGLLDKNGIGDGEDYAPLNDYLGYIDSDCTATWTCPDKLYIQQMVADHENRLWFYDDAVTVGDLRFYVPVNDPNSPFYDPEEDWPECGTKVTCADIDVEYAVTEVFTNYDFIKFVDRNNNGVFDEGIDHVYIDMDESNDVTLYDVRLTDVSIKDAFYPNNTKVMTQHDLDLGDTLLPADLYITVSDLDLLAVVPYVEGYGPADPTVELPAVSTNFTVSMFDNDCSRDWTCVDALYLSIDDEFRYDDYAVTHKDIRLFIPPELICDGEVPDNGCDYNAYDANQNYIIEFSEVSAAIDDFIAGDIDFSVVSGLIDLFKLDGPYCE